MTTISALPRVIIVSLLFGGIAYAFTFTMKPTYESDEVLYFPQSAGSTNPMDLLKSGGANVDNGAVKLMNGVLVSPLVGAGAETASGIVTSHTAIRTTVDTLDLDKKWALQKEDAYDQLAKWADAKVDKNGMLDISTKAYSPQQAVDILKTLERYLAVRSSQLTVNVSKSNREYLEKRVTSAEGEVNRIQGDLVQTMRQSPLADVPDLMKNYYAAQVDLQKAEVAQVAAAGKLTALEAESKELVGGPDSFPNNIMKMSAFNTDVKTLTDQIQTRRLALSDAMANFTPNSAEYKKAVKDVTNAESIGKEITKNGRGKVDSGLTPDLILARSDLAALKDSTGRYQKILDQYEASALQAPGQFAAVERKKAEFDEGMKAYGLLRQQLELAKLAESRDPSKFAVLDEPYPNSKPVGPRRGLISAIVFLVAGLVQLALLSLREETVDAGVHPELNGQTKARREIPAEEHEPAAIGKS